MSKYKIVVHTPLGVFESKEEEFGEDEVAVLIQWCENINKLSFFNLVDKDGNNMYFAGDVMKRSMVHIVKV